eukprot:m51a1_g11693 hypothetical protein (434) ;mRNA; r:672-13317
MHLARLASEASRSGYAGTVYFANEHARNSLRRFADNCTKVVLRSFRDKDNEKVDLPDGRHCLLTDLYECDLLTAVMRGDLGKDHVLLENTLAVAATRWLPGAKRGVTLASLGLDALGLATLLVFIITRKVPPENQETLEQFKERVAQLPQSECNNRVQALVLHLLAVNANECPDTINAVSAYFASKTEGNMKKAYFPDVQWWKEGSYLKPLADIPAPDHMSWTFEEPEYDKDRTSELELRLAKSLSEGLSLKIVDIRKGLVVKDVVVLWDCRGTDPLSSVVGHLNPLFIVSVELTKADAKVRKTVHYDPPNIPFLEVPDAVALGEVSVRNLSEAHIVITAREQSVTFTLKPCCQGCCKGMTRDQDLGHDPVVYQAEAYAQAMMRAQATGETMEQIEGEEDQKTVQAYNHVTCRAFLEFLDNHALMVELVKYFL